MVGDSPFRRTGFGRINAQAVRYFEAAGWEVASVTGLQAKPPTDTSVKVYPVEYDWDAGSDKVKDALEDFKPDLVFCTSDPGLYAVYMGEMMEAKSTVPYLGYVAIEGEPIAHQLWQYALRVGDFFTCSKFGVDTVKANLAKDIDYVYYGIDHDVFKVNGRREQIRAELGWTDKFVVMCVAQNVRRKQHPRLFEAISHLKYKYKQTDIVLYDHTVPQQQHWLEGWNLNEIAYMYGVFEEVGFNPQMNNGFGSSIDETGDGILLPDLYNAADLFVLPSQVEGFGLPAAEAMACGLPCLVTRYAAGWEIVSPAGAGIPVTDWETHKSGSRYANVDPMDIAKEILRLKRDPKRRQRMSEAGLERVKAFQWDAFGEKLIDAATESVRKAQEKASA